MNTGSICIHWGEEGKEKHRLGYFAYVASIVADVRTVHVGGILSNLGPCFTHSYFSRLLTVASCYYRHTRKNHGIHVIFSKVSWLAIMYSVLDTWTWKPTDRTEFKRDICHRCTVSVRMNQRPAIPQRTAELAAVYSHFSSYICERAVDKRCVDVAVYGKDALIRRRRSVSAVTRDGRRRSIN